LNAAKRSADKHGEEGARARPPEKPMIELREERLRVGGRRVEAGGARLHKRVVSEEQTLQIPVMVDARLVIHRRAVTRKPGIEPADSEMVVPLIREEVRLERRPRVYERAGLAVDTKASERPVETELRREEVREERRRIQGLEESGSGGDPGLL
jgi:uncharacterized protein (TIGR02271 family)